MSSSGHIAVLGNLLGVDVDLFFLIMLHMGTLVAVILYFRREIRRCLLEIAGIGIDIRYNSRQMLKAENAAADGSNYRKISAGNYRKIVIMIMLAMIPVIIIGMLLTPVIELVSNNMLCAGTGLFITALILFVASFANVNERGPKEARLTDALFAGAFQAMAYFPGISRFAMTYSFCMYKGYSKKFSRLFSFLLLIPITAGAFIYEGVSCNWAAPKVGMVPALCAAVAAMAVGYYVIDLAMKLTEKISVRRFSLYCFLMGAVSVLLYLS